MNASVAWIQTRSSRVGDDILPGFVVEGEHEHRPCVMDRAEHSSFNGGAHGLATVIADNDDYLVVEPVTPAFHEHTLDAAKARCREHMRRIALTRDSQAALRRATIAVEHDRQVALRREVLADHDVQILQLATKYTRFKAVVRIRRKDGKRLDADVIPKFRVGWAYSQVKLYGSYKGWFHIEAVG